MVKVTSIVLGVLVVIAVVLWWPYETTGIPEWRVQVMDRAGKPLPNVQVNQEWLDPIEDGIVSAGTGYTDANGVAVFPKRVLHNRLAFGFVRGKPNARVFTCWQDQYGDLDWDGVSPVPPKTITLKKGYCPYG